ncbi:MAG: hypothetical protein QOJ51_3896, partial [Acidobacteriaceae bacterium]|nr:hypothetical protein [Acidobacteriaceae bacterium]
MAITNSNEIKNPTKPLTPWAR